MIMIHISISACVYIYIYIHIYIYIYIYIIRLFEARLGKLGLGQLPLEEGHLRPRGSRLVSPRSRIYIYIYACMYVCIYIYIYRERESYLIRSDLALSRRAYLPLTCLRLGLCLSVSS